MQNTDSRKDISALLLMQNTWSRKDVSALWLTQNTGSTSRKDVSAIWLTQNTGSRKDVSTLLLTQNTGSRKDVSALCLMQSAGGTSSKDVCSLANAKSFQFCCTVLKLTGSVLCHAFFYLLQILCGDKMKLCMVLESRAGASATDVVEVLQMRWWQEKRG